MGRSTQVQQCFGKGHTLISSREGRGDEHRDGLAASLVSLVHLVCFVDLVSFIQPKNQTNQINKTNQCELPQPAISFLCFEVSGRATTSSAFDCGSDAMVMGGSAQVVRFSCGLGTIGAQRYPHQGNE